MEISPSFVYIASNKWNSVLYTGSTNDPKRRLKEHKSGHRGFANHYKICKIIYLENYSTLKEARFRENQIKGLSRIKKLKLIWQKNPRLEDLIL